MSGVTFTKKPPFTLTYRIQPRARWSDGVPVTARDFVFTLRARIARKAELNEEERRVVEPSEDCLRCRREDRSSCAAYARCRLARPLREHPAAARARGGEARKHLGRRNRQPEDGQADRERALPHRALGARRAVDPDPQSPLLGTTRVSRQARPPLPRPEHGAGGMVPARRARHRLGLSRCASCLSRAPSGAGHQARQPAQLVVGAPRDQGRPRRSSIVEEQARPAGARLRDRPDGARPAGAQQSCRTLRCTTASCS